MTLTKGINRKAKRGNLVLARSEGEVVWIGETRVEVCRVQGNRVKLAIAGPKDIKILRGEIRPMDAEDVVDLLETATTPEEWNSYCDQVKKSHSGQYPGFWYAAVLESGLMQRVTSGFVTGTTRSQQTGHAQAG